MFSSGLEWVRSRAPAGFDHTQWHNYAMTYDIATGDRTFYMDGASVGGDNSPYAAGASWIGNEPFLFCKSQPHPRPASHPKLAPCAAWTLCLLVFWALSWRVGSRLPRLQPDPARRHRRC